MIGVGDRVVCVDDSGLLWCDNPSKPVDGEVYVVGTCDGEYVGIHVNEEAQWYIHRFKPVKTTNIDQFIEMANNIDKGRKITGPEGPVREMEEIDA